MKTKLMYTVLLLLGMIFHTSCSEDFFLDDYKGEQWNGEGFPSWIDEKNESYKQELDRFYDKITAHSDYLLCHLYRFKHQDKWYVSMSYERCYPSVLDPEMKEFHFTSRTLFYNAYGREVNPNKVKKSFEMSKELIWSNEIGPDGYIPQIKDFRGAKYLEYNQGEQDWLQNMITGITESVSAQNGFIVKINVCNCSVSDENKYVEIFYRWYNRNEATLVNERCYFSLDGEEVQLDGKIGFYPSITLYVFLHEIGMDYRFFI